MSTQMDLIEQAAHDLAHRYPKRGWYALGPGGTAQVRHDMEVLRALGFRPVGYGRPPAGAEVVYGPTGTVNPGGPRSRTKWYIGRWYRLRPAAEDGSRGGVTIRTLDGMYTLTPDEARMHALGLWGKSNVRCGSPLPSLAGDGVCLRCGWQHARRGPGAVERVAQAAR